ncbi:MAG: helix-turn-helix domain-containing protein [Chthoniobacterales bacterium]|nr:helix-turn-helix domain-containing protein [Chthoniobacterales bacterium]
MEPLGKKLQEARLRKKISVEEASRVTKIRALRLQEIEAEDFSSFSSLAYAKGFLLIYGKYLDVDVTPYLETFETSRELSVDGYSYLQDAPATAPRPIVRRQPAKRPALLPFIIAVAVLVFGLYLVKLLLDIQRITPSRPVPGVVASATPSPSASPAEKVIAPRALPVEGSPASEARVTPAPTPTPEIPVPSPSEPEVRRAEPVHPEDLASPNVSAPPLANRVQITPMRKTFLRVSVDEQSEPAFNGWLDPADPPLTFRGQHLRVKVLERGAVQITKNGAALPADDTDVTFE